MNPSPNDVAAAVGRAWVKRHGFKQHKYRAKPTVVDGIKFPSKREAARWSQLCLMQKAGAISGLERQIVFQVYVERVGSGGMKPVFKYYADFAYMKDGVRVIEDAKGFKTPLYRLKKKCVELQYGIEIVEV